MLAARYHGMIKTCADLGPVLIFFASYMLGDLRTAVTALLIAMPAALCIQALAGSRPTKVQIAVCAVAMLLCALTLISNNSAFILAKPTIVYWSLAAGLVIAILMGSNPAKAAWSSVFSKAQFSDQVWSRVHVEWVSFLLFLGALNWILVLSVSEKTWVVVKTFGFTALFFVFVIVQAIVLSARARQTDH